MVPWRLDYMIVYCHMVSSETHLFVLGMDDEFRWFIVWFHTDSFFSQSLLLQLILHIILASLLESCPVIQVKLIYCPKLGILLDIFQKLNISPVKWDRLTLPLSVFPWLIKSALTSIIMFFLGYSCIWCPCESCQCGEKNGRPLNSASTRCELQKCSLHLPSNYS